MRTPLDTTPSRWRTLAIPGATLIVLALSGCGSSGTTGGSSLQGWTAHQDPKGFRLETPSDWQVSSQPSSGEIDASGPNGDRLAIEPFFTRFALTPADAPAALEKLGAKLMPNGQWQAAAALGDSEARMSGSVGGQDASAVLTYVVTAKGTAGQIYIATTTQKGALQRDAGTLSRIAASLKTWGPALSSAPSLAYENWTAPPERAFSVEIPKGWSVAGSTTRPATTLVQWSVQVTSPDKTMSVFMGDIFPVYVEPFAFYRQGQSVPDPSGYNHPVEPYLAGARFVTAIFGPNSLPGFTPLKQQDRPDIAATYAAIPGISHYDAGEVDFTFTGLTGQKVHGAAVSITELLTPSPGFVIWDEKQLTIWAGTDDTFGEAGDVMAHMATTFSIDPQWLASHQNAEMAQSRIITDVGHQISDTISQGFWGQQAIQDEISRRRENATLDTVDVASQAGQPYKVENSSDYYWLTPNGPIVGTDSNVPPCSNCEALFKLP